MENTCEFLFCMMPQAAGLAFGHFLIVVMAISATHAHCVETLRARLCTPKKAALVLQSMKKQYMLRKLVYFEFGNLANVTNVST